MEKLSLGMGSLNRKLREESRIQRTPICNSCMIDVMTPPWTKGRVQYLSIPIPKCTKGRNS